MNSALAARTVFAMLKARTRGLLVAAFAFEVAARLVVVVTAVVAARGAALPAVALAVCSTVLFGALRASLAVARVAVERDVYAAAAGAVLRSDVLELETGDLRQVVLDGTHHGTVLVAQQLPSVAGDLIALAVVAPVLASMLPARVLVIASLAVFGAMGVAALLRGRARRSEQAEMDAYGRVYKTLVATVESRLEIVARAGERAQTEGLAGELDAYASVVRRTSLLRAFFGRVPLAAGALLVAAAVLLEGGARADWDGVAIGHALVLAAVFPVVRGAALGAFGLSRSLVHLAPLAEIVRKAAPDATTSGRRLAPPFHVRAEGVSFRYADGRDILRDVTFDWSAAEPLVVVGPNGSGKSTLLRLLLGLRAPTAGRLVFNETNLAESDLAALRAEMGYLPQRPYLGERWDTVESAMQVPGRVAARADLLRALERVGYDDAAAILPLPLGSLSAGQRQRVALARLVLRDVPVYLLDEPDADLDREGIALVTELVRDLGAKGKLVVIAAHGAELRALSKAPLELGP